MTLVVSWHWLFARRETLLLQAFAPILLAVVMQRLARRWLLAVFQDALLIDLWHRRISALIWLLALLEVLGLSDAVMEVADSLTMPIGNHSVSLLKLVQGSVIVIVALLSAIWLSRTLERRIMSLDALDASLRVAMAKVVQGGMIALSVVLTLPLIGVDTTFLSVIGGALGVGLGFGLQKIASNYVSGFIILLDRSVRLNDLISVDGRKGVVTQMEARYMVLRSVDGTEAVVPNETFVTGTVINHTLGDRSGVLSVTWWLAHEADLRLVVERVSVLPLEFAGVMAEPPPTLQILLVNDIGIEVQLSWWVSDLSESDAALRSAVLFRVMEVLRAAAIPLAKRPVLVGNSSPL
jgi:small-conductance mechanosensitive channel